MGHVVVRALKVSCQCQRSRTPDLMAVKSVVFSAYTVPHWFIVDFRIAAAAASVWVC